MAEFNLEGLLGNAFGGGTGNFLDEYLTPEQRAAMQRNAMLAASAALLKAGGENTRRIGIGEALGEALQAGQGGYEKAQTGALTQMALKTKLDEAKKAKELQKLIAGVFAPQAATRGTAPVDSMLPPSAPGPMPKVGDTYPYTYLEGEKAGTSEQRIVTQADLDQVQNYRGPQVQLPASLTAPAQGMATPMNPNAARANQYRQAAQMLNMAGQTEQAIRYEEIAYKLDPTPTLSEKTKLLAELGLKPTVANLRSLEKPEGPSEKSKQLAELGLAPTLDNFQLLESSPNEAKLLKEMGLPVNMANVTALRRASAGPAADRAPTLTTIVDPTNPNQMLSIDARRYSGGGVGSPGVLGVSGKEPGAATRQVKTEAGKSQLADDLSNLRASFLALDKMQSIPSTQRGALSNITSGISASGIGQRAGQLLGTEAQVERDVINSARSRLVNSIKNATGMSAQQLNSNVELQTMLKSISDPGHSIQAALRIIDDIEKAYVTGSGMAPPPPAGRLTPAQQAELDKLRLRFGGQK